MLLAVIIINFRTPSVTLDCLRSLAPELEAIGGARAILVDNGSGDGSVRLIQEEQTRRRWRWLEVVQLEKNLGFAAGNNQGMARASDAEFVLFLNSDTVVHRGCLSHGVAVMRSEPMIGAMSGLLLNTDGTAQVTARRFSPPARQFPCALGLPWRFPRWFAWADPWEDWDRRTTRRDVDWIGGAFMLCRGELLRRLGGFDEDFFFYGEDYELCHRIHRAGYRIHYDPRAVVTHLGGGSSDDDRLPTPQRLRHMWNGRYLAFAKCHGRLAMMALRAVDLLNYIASAAASRLRGGAGGERSRHRAVLRTLAGRG